MPKRKNPTSRGDDDGQKRKKKALWNKQFKHNGPMFPPKYKSIGGNFRYGGEIIKLSKETKEYADYYARYALRNKPDKVFNDNFFKSWRALMKPQQRNKIISFSKCNFSDIMKQLQKKSEEKKKMTSEMKRREREKKQREVEHHQYVTIDGRPEKIGNIYVEIPGLFIGRGDNKLRGTVKPRIRPEDVTINCDERSKPQPPSGRWKEVVHDRSAMWLAKWTDPITGKPKYIQPDGSSKLKSDNDQRKFETAENLRKNIGTIRKKYLNHLKSNDSKIRQHATALYLIDEFALRAGNEKSKDEADTVGCCSLRKRHIKFKGNNIIAFDFHAKDFIRYKNEAKIKPKAYQNLKLFCEGKGKEGSIFDEISTITLNRYLTELMPGLTIKVFRTFKATECFENNIKKQTLRPGAENWEKKLACAWANLEVAKLLNHRTLAKRKGNKKVFEKMRKKIQKKQSDLKRFKGDKSRKKKAENELKKLQKEKEFKEILSNYALGTSKQNYIDPRVVVEWCRKKDVELKLVYTPKQLQKFKWAFNVKGTKFFD